LRAGNVRIGQVGPYGAYIARAISPAPMTLRTRLRYALAVAMIAVGTLHFALPGWFVSIVPAALPSPLALVLVSGFFEILGGVGLLVARARRAASIGLVLLYVAVFPANINMIVDAQASHGVAPWLLWARLPLQAVFIAWALYVGRSGSDGRPSAPSP
jgi:uncharacterized membrane protein